MAFHNPHLTSLFPQVHSVSTSTVSTVQRRSPIKLAIRLGSSLMALSLSIGMALPVLAADPFRANTSTPVHAIGDLTENAFEAIFKRGNYQDARQILAQAETAESGEPLVHAMLASMAYLDNDFAKVYDQALKTQSAASALKASDPLRGHLYTAVGSFLEGAYVLKTEGVAKGTPRALGMLQQVFRELDDAEAINADDPELNLLKGYMDLMLAVNLPFSNPDQAIARMSSYGSPIYLAQRGIAIGYRDLDQPDAALVAVDKAIAAAPNNPELLYLKAQILNRQGNKTSSVDFFDQALTYSAQLPPALVARITWERCVILPSADTEACSRQAGY